MAAKIGSLSARNVLKRCRARVWGEEEKVLRHCRWGWGHEEEKVRVGILQASVDVADVAYCEETKTLSIFSRVALIVGEGVIATRTAKTSEQVFYKKVVDSHRTKTKEENYGRAHLMKENLVMT